MPSRVLREGILTSESVCSLSFQAEVFYRRLMSVVDDFGRFDGRVSVLRSRLYPVQIDKVREADITRWVAECETAGVIALYVVDAKPYILFHKADPPRSQSPKFPAPPAVASKLKAADNVCTPLYTATHSRIQPHTPVTDSYSGSESESDSSSESIVDSSEPVKAPASKPANATDPPPETILTFSTVGKGAKVWHLSASQVADWQVAYPNVDVIADCRKALAWVLANPAKTKTAGGMPNFLVRWLNKTNDSLGSRPHQQFAGASLPKPPLETSIDRIMRIAAQMEADKARKAPGGG